MKPQKMVLVDPSHKLPIPGTSRLFPTAGETVDMHNPFWIALERDGSIKVAPAESEPTSAAAEAASPSVPSIAEAEAAVAALHAH